MGQGPKRWGCGMTRTLSILSAEEHLQWSRGWSYRLLLRPLERTEQLNGTHPVTYLPFQESSLPEHSQRPRGGN